MMVMEHGQNMHGKFNMDMDKNITILINFESLIIIILTNIINIIIISVTHYCSFVVSGGHIW